MLYRIYILLFLNAFVVLASAQSGGYLLVANKGEHTLSVFDIAGRKQIALIPVGEAPHELAVSADGRTAVVCNYGASVPGNTLTVIDIPAKKQIRTISTGIYTRPHGIEFISANEVVVTSETTKNLLQININTGNIDLVIPTEQERSHMVAWSATDKMAYVSNINSGTVSAISLQEKKVLKQLNLKKV
jgi:YVTN family beta-propeller protein